MCIHIYTCMLTYRLCYLRIHTIIYIYALMLCMTVCLHAGTGRCDPPHRVLRYTPVTGFPPFFPWGRFPPGGSLLLERCRADVPVHIHICIFAHRRFSHVSNCVSTNSTWTRLCAFGNMLQWQHVY